MSLELIEKLILASILSIILIYPVYKFIYIITARKYSIEQFEKIKTQLRKKSFLYSSIITILFSLIYSLKVL